MSVRAMRHLISVTLLAAVLGACAPSGAARPTIDAPPTRISPSAGKGGIVGTLANAAQIWPEATLTIWAAEYVGPDVGGFFVLEPNTFPQTIVHANGYFQINDVPPARYVLVVGPVPDLAKLIGEGDLPQVVEVSADAVAEIGTVSAMP